MNLAPNNSKSITLGFLLLTFSYSATAERSQELDYFVLRCGSPEAEIMFIENTAEISEIEAHVMSVVNLDSFDKPSIANKLFEFIEYQSSPVIVVPVQNFNYKDIAQIAMEIGHENLKLNGTEISPPRYCSNTMKALKLSGEESLEKAAASEFKKPMG